jgi:hypothetical protein
MDESKALVVRDHLEVGEVRQQVNLIQEIMREVMHEGEHYGKIPGCGDKPALLKPGAEKLNLTFRMSPTYDIERLDMPGGHREYIITCTLKTIGSDVILGQGVGSCSSLESKYRFQTGPKESTGKPVPKEYWDYRKSDAAKAQTLLGGKGFGTMKNDAGQWVISIQGEKVENTNPADQFNTILKMAKKRAHVDAVLTVTAASDIFTQDIEDFTDTAPRETNGKVVDVQPVEVTRVSKMIDILTKSGKLGNAERFLDKDSSRWTDADIDRIENAKKKNGKKEALQAPPVDVQGEGQPIHPLCDAFATCKTVEAFRAITQDYMGLMQELTPEQDVALEKAHDDCKMRLGIE